MVHETSTACAFRNRQFRNQELHEKLKDLVMKAFLLPGEKIEHAERPLLETDEDISISENAS